MAAPIAQTVDIKRGEYPRVLPAANRSGQVTVGYAIESDKIDTNTTRVVTSLARFELTDGLLIKSRSMPLGANVRALVEAVAAAGLADQTTGVLITGLTDSTPAIEAAAQRITGPVDRFYLDAEIVIVVPPAVILDYFGRLVKGTNRDVAKLVGAFVPAPAADGRVRVVNPETARRLGNPRTVWSILRDYRLAAEPLKLPYKNLDLNAPEDGADPNCLARYLKQRYHHGQSKGKKIALKAINKMVGEDPTAENLKAFAEKYKIRTLLHDVSGRCIHNSAKDYAHNKGRTPLVAVLYGNHVYPYVGDLRKKVSLEPDGESDLPLYRDERYVADGDEEENSAFEQFLKTSFTPNFKYASEYRVVQQALMWYDVKAGPTEESICWDMKGAYDTVIRFLAGDKEQVPVFTAHDVIEPFYPDIDSIVPYAYYWVSAETQKRWESGPSYVQAHISDLFHGFEVEYLLERGVLELADLVYHKTPSYTLPVEKFRKTLDNLCEGDENRGKSYRTYNGLLGRTTTNDKWMSFAGCSAEDAELLAQDRPAEDFEAFDTDDHDLEVRLRVRKGSYLHFNNRNIYNFVVARTNLEMYKFVHETCLLNPEAKVIKIKVDGVAFDRAVVLPEALGQHFRTEELKWKPHTFSARSTNPEEIRKGTLAEIANWRSRCRIITGPPGTGKTHLIKEGTDQTPPVPYDVACTTTNTAARNLDTERITGETIYKALQLFTPENLFKVLNGLHRKILWLDEFSMVQRYIWSYLFVVGKHTTLTILTGDPDQIPPIGEELDYEGTFLTNLFLDKEVLEKDWRNDTKLVRLRDFVKNNPPAATLRKLTHELDHTHLKDEDDPADYGTHLVATHRVRRKLNAYITKKKGLKWTHRLKRVANAPGGLRPTFSKARDYLHEASEGLLLTARITRKCDHIYKGSRYVLLTEVDKDTKTFKVHRIGDADGLNRELSIKFLKTFDLGYALTIQSSQGLTIREPFCIWEAQNILVGRHSDSRLLYTAITRGCKFEDLRVRLKGHPLIENVKPEPEIGTKELGVDEDAFRVDYTYRG